MWWWLAVCVLVSASGSYANEAKSVCYTDLGCFDLKSPFDNTQFLPAKPEDVDTKFRLFTTKNQKTEDFISFQDTSSFTKSHLNILNPVKVLIHGWRNHYKLTSWFSVSKDELLKVGDYNVIIVDWNKGAATLNYYQAVANVRLVATQIKNLLVKLENHGVSLRDSHLVGHSLGAHIAGYVGYLMPTKIARITGLDPADPAFQNKATPVRLDPSDAGFVDVIHSDSGSFNLLSGFGLGQAVGHVDFYPNGGKSQPGCGSGSGLDKVTSLIDTLLGKNKDPNAKKSFNSCDHGRASKYFWKSINSACKFRSIPCESYEKFLKGDCSCAKGGCSVMGLNANKYSGRGVQYLQTLSDVPFCGYEYKVTFVYKGSKVPVGQLSIAVRGNDGVDTLAGVLDTAKSKTDSTKVIGMVILNKKVTSAKSINVQFDQSDENDTSALVIKKLEMKSLDDDKTITAKDGTYSVANDGTTLPVL